jgi:tetratricopeptide (TPR) repeat protein
MKKIVLASVMALAVISLVSAPTLRAQDAGTITIKDPAEYNSYSQATTQSDPKAKAAALESFLNTYPQSVVKADVLKMLLETYQGLGDADHALSAANRLLQVDPANMEAIFLSVAIKVQQCKKGVDPKTGFATDPQPCDDAAALAQKGLVAPKPAAVSADAWKTQTDTAYPVFDSAIAADDVYSKKDFKAAVDEYRKELMLFPAAGTTSGTGLVDTLNLAEGYARLEPADAKAARDADLAAKAVTDPTAKPAADQAAKDAKAKDTDDYIEAIWFYARAWNFAPAGFKPQIEKKLDYWFNKFHGNLDGLDAIKSQAAATVFPPGTLVISPAATPQEKIHAILVNTPDLTTLALADKELVLSYGSKDDADKLWALMKDKDTPVPGVVIEATASVIKIAVTDDAKQAKTPDFIVNLKTPLADKDIPQPGFEYGLSSKSQPELDGTYDSYTQVPATDTVAQSAQIVLRDGTVVPVKKAVVHKPAAGHHTASH